MKLLFVSQYYPPETGACANRISGFARHLSRLGHDVTVITGFPNYPERRLYPGYRRAWISKDSDGAVKLFRTWVSLRYPVRPWHRLINYTTFFISSLCAGIFRAPRTDCVIATSGPILVGLTGALISWVRRIPFVLDIRDVWPERVVAAGEFKSKFAIRLLEKIESFLYNHAQLIFCVTEGVRAKLAHKGVDPSKLCLLTNGTDMGIFHPREKDVSLRKELGIPEDAFVAVYAGTMGLFQDHQLLLKVALALKSYPQIYFLFIGEGVRRSYLESEIKKHGLSQARLLRNQSVKVLGKLLACSDVGINANTPIEHNQMAIPVKMFDYMASGLPVVLANGGDARQLVESHEIGFCVSPGNDQDFAKCLLKLYQDRSLGQQMGKRGIVAVQKYFSSQQLTLTLEREIQIALGMEKVAELALRL